MYKSLLGFDFKDGEFGHNLKIEKITHNCINEDYKLIIGKVKQAHNCCNEVTIRLTEKSTKIRTINLVVRAYNDGIAFRYEFPAQHNWNSYVMLDENTQFNLQGNPKALFMYLPGYTSSHEALYNYINIDAIKENTLIEMPITFEYPNGPYLAITEAAIVDYAGMYLSKMNGRFKGKLSPRPGQEKVKVVIDTFPHHTPWRVIMIGNKIETLLESNILTSLNTTCQITDTSWIRSYKTTFPWWNGNMVPDTTFSPGNNFETNKYYIDFAAQNGIDLHNIYGYAETPWYYDDNFDFEHAGPHADVTRSVPCLNLPRICHYSDSLKTGIYLWVNWQALYPKLNEAFSLYHKWGIKGLMIDFMNRDDQEMIRIQEKFLKTAAKYKLFIQFHGSSKPSGLNRTYPNELSREGTLNYEAYKWSDMINANHDISIPFTRMLAGSTDYHLGGFRATPRSHFKIRYTNPLVTSTRCHMLAMYVVLENHLVTLCDTPDAYKGQLGFKYLREVPGNWDQIKVINAKLNEYITVARKNGNDWWIGSITNQIPRNMNLSLDFLDKGKKYLAEIYTDTKDAYNNPNHLKYEEKIVSAEDFISISLASDGGAALHIKNINTQ